MLHNCIEAREEFEDPEEDMRRMYVLKLFNGLHEWNFGLFVQEIFKHEMKARKSNKYSREFLNRAYLKQKEFFVFPSLCTKKAHTKAVKAA